MLQLNSEEKEEKKDLELDSNTFNQKCFDKNWVLLLNQPKEIKHHICLICGHVANNAMELDCPQHENMKRRNCCW